MFREYSRHGLLFRLQSLPPSRDYTKGGVIEDGYRRTRQSKWRSSMCRLFVGGLTRRPECYKMRIMPTKTVVVREDLHREVRILAAERGCSIQSIVEEAIRQYLEEVKDGEPDKRTPPG